ncbi:MAG: hypothetical protein ACUVTN_05570 [Thermodesulfobacteriota bacterium]
MSYQFNTDCEGPITKNDNAMELSKFYIPFGTHFFALISKYDDYLADIEKRPGYKAGDTLKLILPFLKAYGATDEGIRKFSREHLLLLPGAKEALQSILQRMETFIISTSYEPYLDALCDIIDFPKDRIYCTSVHLDQYGLKREERERLLQLAQEIESMEMIEWPDQAKAPEDISEKNRTSIQRLNAIFWKEIREMEIGRIFSEVHPMGGKEKAKAVLHSLERTANRLDEVLYVGDSITDVEAFQLVKQAGGVTVSFNGNRYALRSAEIACLSSNAFILAILAEIFRKGGREGLMELIPNWSQNQLVSWGIDKEWIQRAYATDSKNFPMIYRVTDENRKEIIHKSESFRKRVRGISIGSLG